MALLRRAAQSRTWRRLGALAATVGIAAVTACGPSAPTPPAPFKDADNGGANDHGWFEGGKVWRGSFADPHVVRVGSLYYAYATPTGGRVLPVLTSTDLTTWRVHPRWSDDGPPGTRGYDVNSDPKIPAEIRASADGTWGKYDNNDALVRFASWGLPEQRGPWINRTYWAPGVIQIGSTWYAYHAVKVSNTSDDPHGHGRFCLTVASATSPMGPFRDVSGGAPIQCQAVSSDPAGSIDPYPYRAPNGKYYLLFKAAGKVGVRESALMSVELGLDGRPKPGAPTVKLLETSRTYGWEGSTIENPAMITYNGTTYLFYSANFYGQDAAGRSNYATGYAICPSGPTGPCHRPAPQRPLLASSGVDQGPGGASAFTDTDGRLRLAYATYWLGETRLDGTDPRRLKIATLVQNPDKTLRLG